MGVIDDLQSSLFFTGGAGAPPTLGASAQDMRRKIALAMLMKKTPFPKTFGEGLAAIGDAWGDRSLASRVEQDAQAQSTATDAAIAGDAAKATGATAAPAAATGPRAEAGDPPLAAVASAIDTPLEGGAIRPATPPVATAPPVSGVLPNVASWNAFATRPRQQGGLGVSGEQAAGVVGNLQAESSPSIKPAGVVGDNGTAFGAAQWRGDRFANLQGFAKANGMDPMSTEAQQAFMRHEMTGSGPYGGGSEAKAYAALTGAQDPGSAASAFDRNYERSDGRSTDYRQRVAQQLAQNTPLAVASDRQNPMGPADRAQTALLSDVTGMRRAPPSFGATASNRAGDVQSDMPPVTGALQGPLGASVGDTVQARQDTLSPPQQPPGGQQLPPQQVAQAGPGVFPPVVSAGGQPQAILPGGGLPPPIAPQISQAPPDPRAAIRAAPSIRDEYVPPEKDPQPEPPAKPGMGPIEQQLTRDVLNKDVDPRRKEAAARMIAAEQAQRAIPYENQVLKYKADIANWQKRQEQTLGYQMGLPKQRAETEGQYATTRNITLEGDKRALELGGYPAQLVQEKQKRAAEVGSAQAEAEMKQEDARIKSRTGQLPSELYPKLDKEKDSVDRTIKAQNAQQLARKAIRDGVITGYGANGVLVGAKFADWAFKNGMSGNIAANTEIMSATLKNGLTDAVETINGVGGKVSDSDLKIAQGIQATDPNLQLKTIQTIMDRASEINHKKIDGYESKIDRYLSGEKAEDFYKVGGSSVPPDKLQILLTEPTDQRKAQFNTVYGPGAAELELARAKRAQDRGR